MGRGGKYNRIKTFHQWTLEPNAGGTRLEYVYETEPPLPTDRLVEAVSGRRGWFRRNGGKAPAAPAQHPRGEPGSRRAGDHRRTRLTRPMPRLARLASLLLVTAAALGAAGCFNKEEQATLGETEGIYVTVDDLKYQVQISRILDPASPEDSAYLRGVPAGEGDPGQDEVWFAVFMRVENDTDERARDGRGVHDHRHAGQRVRAGRARPGAQPLRLRAAGAPARRADARARLARRGQHDPRARCCSSSSRPSRSATARVELEIASPTGGENAVIDLDI